MTIQKSRIRTIAITMAAALVSVFFIWIFQNQPQEPEPPNFDTLCVVTRVIDGDTIECDNVVIRLIGIDAPEINWSSTGSRSTGPGFESQQALIRILSPLPRLIGLNFNNRLADIYGRVLAHTYLLDGESIQQLMLDRGYAKIREVF